MPPTRWPKSYTKNSKRKKPTIECRESKNREDYAPKIKIAKNKIKTNHKHIRMKIPKKKWKRCYYLNLIPAEKR